MLPRGGKQRVNRQVRSRGEPNAIVSAVLIIAVLLTSAAAAPPVQNDVASFCSSTSNDSDSTWICYFSLTPVVRCRQRSSAIEKVVSDRDDVLSLSPNRMAYVNISECSSVLPNNLPLNLISQFENFAVAFNAEGQHANSCPNIHVLSDIFKRISHPAKCLVLLNITQELLDSAQNLDRFEGLSEFSLINSPITSITTSLYDFVHSSNVERVVIRNTNLTTFDMAYRNFNQSLRYLDLSDNKLVTFIIDENASFPNAVSIKASNNRLHMTPSYLRFDHTLTSVDLSNCTLRSIEDLQGQMHALNLSHNSISEFKNSTFENVGSLAILDLSYNSLPELPDWPLGAHLSLIEINLSHNKIASIPDRVFANSTTLSRLDLSYNLLETISSSALNFSRLHALEFLRLDHNRLFVIPSIEPCSDSFVLMLSSNLLTSLSVLPTKYNRHLTVVAQNNSISDIRKINAGMYNEVTSIDQYLWDASFLPEWALTNVERSINIDVSANKIATFDAHVLMAYLVVKPFKHFNVLSFYNLSNNPIDCSCDLLSRVHYLSEAYNASTEHKVSLIFKQVNALLGTTCRMPPSRDSRSKKSGTSLVALSELGTEAAKKQLKCSDDPVRCADECFCSVDAKTGLKKADCAECECLQEMPFTMPPNTSLIYLNGNYIKKLGCRQYLRGARQLLLSNNLIDTIDDCVYRYLKNVELLYLDSNHLTEFPYKITVLESLTRNESVNLSNNSFTCECSEFVHEAFEHLGPRLVAPEDIECHTEDGSTYKYLDYLESCLNPDEPQTFSGVQMLLLVMLSAIVAVVLIIIAIVTYYLCCLKYVTAIRRNFAKVLQRFFTSTATNASRERYASSSSSGLQQRHCSQSCFQRLRNQFQFSPLVTEDELMNDTDDRVADEAEFSLSADNGAAPGRQLNCESAPL